MTLVVKKTNLKRLAAVIIIIGIMVLFCIWQNNDIVVTNYNYSSSKIGNELQGFKIAHISDLHNKKFGKKQKRLITNIKRQSPDIIVITGDIVDSRRTNVRIALDFVKEAVKIAPVYYVTGNHEFRLTDTDWKNLMEGMETAGVVLLDNKTIHLSTSNQQKFYIIGLSDRNLNDRVLTTLNSHLDNNPLRILLAHEPQYIKEYCNSEVDLVLSGHAHGGQFRLPIIGGLVAPGQGFFPKYTSGMHEMNKTTMIISRGLGNSIIPVRIFNRPEIVMITLVAE